MLERKAHARWEQTEHVKQGVEEVGSRAFAGVRISLSHSAGRQAGTRVRRSGSLEGKHFVQMLIYHRRTNHLPQTRSRSRRKDSHLRENVAGNRDAALSRLARKVEERVVPLHFAEEGGLAVQNEVGVGWKEAEACELDPEVFPIAGGDVVP